jgi:unsaturated rhamnogalacturonyl hydrolase
MKFAIVFTVVAVALSTSRAQPVNECWSESLGFPCCPSDYCEVAKTDSSGSWGIFDNNWCGISTDCEVSDDEVNVDIVNDEESIVAVDNNDVEDEIDSGDEEEKKEFSNEFVFNIEDNLNNKKTVSVAALEDLELNIDGYHFSGAFEDAEYTKYFDFTNVTQSNAYDIFLKYDKREQYKKQSGIDLNSYVDSLIERTTSFIPYWNKESFKGKWNYIDGVFLNSVVNLYKKTNNEKYKEFFIKYINYYVAEDGTFVHYTEDGVKTVDNDLGWVTGELDTVCESKILFDAYEMTGDKRYLTAIEFTYQKLMEMPLCYNSPNFWHKTFYINQIWLDGMYMYAPFLARYAVLKNDLSILDNIKEQYAFIHDNMRDENGLYHHGFDTTKTIFWSKNNDGKSENFWLRSMGWFAVSLADILEYYPEGENKEYLKNVLEELLNGILPFQDKTTKMFYQVIDKPEEIQLVDKFYFSNLGNSKYGDINTFVSNYVESSGSSMFAYSFLKYGKVYQNGGKFEDIGKEIFEAVYQHSYQNHTLSDICITAGLGPEAKTYRDGTLSYYLAEKVGEDDAKGVGPFLMAFIEYNY